MRTKFFRSNYDTYYKAIALLILIAIPFILLDADYSPLRRFGDCGDEGLWIHNARLKILFGKFEIDEMAQTYYGAPIFNLLLFSSYKILGISVFSSRLVSLCAFMLAVLVLYYTIKKYFPPFYSFCFVVLLLLFHEVMMYYEWATPIFLEVLFYSLIILVYEYRQKLNNVLAGILIGTFFCCAVLSKLSSLYFTIPLGLFFISEIFIKKEKVGKVLLYAMLSGAIISGLVIIFFYLPHYKGFIHFYKAIASSNIHTIKGRLTLIKKFPFNFTILEYPGAISILICFILRLVQLVYYNQWKFPKLIKNINTLELYCYCWIFGYFISLSFTGELGYDRRMVTLYIPCFIVAFIFLFENKSYYSAIVQTTIPIINKRKKELLKLICVTTLCVYFFHCLAIVPRQRFFLNIFDVGHSWIYISFCALFSILIAYLFTYHKNKELLKTILVSYFVLCNIFFTAIWFCCRTYSLRDYNTKMESIQPRKNDTYVYGYQAQLFCMNNSIFFPVIYRTDPIGSEFVNKWFDDYSKQHPFYLFQVTKASGNFKRNLLPEQGDFYYLLQKTGFSHVSPGPIDSIRLCRYPFTNQYRYEAVFCKVNDSTQH